MDPENIIRALDIKISEIKSNNKIPVIFLLVGTYPGFSQIHQTPPFICDLLDKYPNMSPIVILFDTYYKHNKTPLLFLNHHDYSSDNIPNKSGDIEYPVEGTWYYPQYVPSLKNSYEGKVAYQYYGIEVSENILIKTSYAFNQYLIFLWNFTGYEIINNFTLKIIKKSKVYKNLHINKADCSANIYYDIDYYPAIKYDYDEDAYVFVNNHYVFNDYVNDIAEILKKIKITMDLKLKDKLQGLFYTTVEKCLNDLKIYHSWEIKIRTDDPLKMITFTKDSSKEEWSHLTYRAGVYVDTSKFINGFMKSKEYLLSDFINTQIYQIGEMIIEFESLSCKKDIVNITKYRFDEEYSNLVNKQTKQFPGLFENFIQKNCNKYSILPSTY